MWTTKPKQDWTQRHTHRTLLPADKEARILHLECGIFNYVLHRHSFHRTNLKLWLSRLSSGGRRSTWRKPSPCLISHWQLPNTYQAELGPLTLGSGVAQPTEYAQDARLLDHGGRPFHAILTHRCQPVLGRLRFLMKLQTSRNMSTSFA